MNSLRDILWLIVIDANRNLLSHAEVREDVVEGFLGGNLAFAGYLSKVGEDEAEVFGKEVAG